VQGKPCPYHELSAWVTRPKSLYAAAFIKKGEPDSRYETLIPKHSSSPLSSPYDFDVTVGYSSLSESFTPNISENLSIYTYTAEPIAKLTVCDNIAISKITS